MNLYGPLTMADEAYVQNREKLKKPRGKDKPVELPPSYPKKYILTIQDAWSRFILLVPMTDKSAEVTAATLMDNFVAIFGFPYELYSDQGKEFANATMTELCSLGGMEHTFSAPYNPQANWAERFHRDLGALLTIGLLKDGSNWISKLAAITGKLPCKWTGLWRVCKVVNDVIIRIEKANSKGPYI